MQAGGCSSPLWRATVNSNDYTYVFDDGTASEEHKELWLAEKAFDDQYFAENVSVPTLDLSNYFLNTFYPWPTRF